jgi:hypothetical protein
MAQVMLVALMLAASYLDYFGYRAQGYYSPGFLDDRLLGHATAPDQYRVGVVWLSHWIVVHLHLPLMWTLASIDLVSGLVAVLALFSVLEHSAVYRDASDTERWFAAAAFVLLMLWFLAWLLWLQKPETLPAAMLVAVTLWLWQKPTGTAAWIWKALLAVALSVALASFRADIACLLNLGIFIFLLASKQALPAMPRAAALTVSLVNTHTAAALQLYLMRIVYPQASYGKVKVLQLWPNLKHASRWPPFVLFLLPLLWMLVQLARRRFHRDAPSLALLCGALCFSALWFTIGKIDEVRIFMPFALALSPLTVELAMLQIRSHGIER